MASYSSCIASGRRQSQVQFVVKIPLSAGVVAESVLRLDFYHVKFQGVFPNASYFQLAVEIVREICGKVYCYDGLLILFHYKMSFLPQKYFTVDNSDALKGHPE